MRHFRIRTAILVLFIVSSLFSSTDAKAETNDSGFINITYLNGLTTNTIYDVCTDGSGCLWLGTATGLSRYDGYYVKNFFKEEMNIRSNIIKYLLCDSRNRIWIGSGNGVGIYDVDSEKFLTLDLLSGESLENKTAGLFEDSEGTIWVSLRKGGVVAINPDTFSTRKYFRDLNDDEYFFRFWFEPETGLYLAASFSGGLFYLDFENNRKIPFSSKMPPPSSAPFMKKKINGMTKVNDKSFCLSCEDGTLWLVNPYDRLFEQLPLESPDDQPYRLRKTFVIKEDIIAIGHDNGLIIYDLKKKSPINHRATAELADKNVYCLCGDIDNGLIVGTYSHGLLIQRESGFQFSTIDGSINGKKAALKGSIVTGFAETDSGSIWVTTRLKGLFRYFTAEKRVRRFVSHDIPQNLEGAVSYKGDLWLLSKSGIYCLAPDSGEVKAYREGMGENHKIVVTKDGKLVVLSENKVFEYDENADSFSSVREFEGLDVLTVSQSDKSSLIAVTEEKGLVKWDGDRITGVDNSSFRNIGQYRWPVLLREDNQANIWSALPESGIMMLSDRHFNILSTRSGLASDIITNLINNDNGSIIITTDRSLSKITPSGKLYSMTRSDGLINFGFTWDSAYKTAAGEILLGSRDGITVIHNTVRKTASAATGTGIVDKVICNGAEVEIKENSIALKHHQNSFDISVSDIDSGSIGAPGRSLFCLEGYDNTWVAAGKDRKLSFLNLKPGKYTFRAYDKGIEPLRIRIHAHPLVSTVAIAVYVILLIILLCLFIVYIRNNEIRKRKEKTIQMEVRLHQEKIDFFTNIAHEIKTPLTLISTPLGHLKSNPNIDNEARYDLEIMDKHASYLSSLIRELLEFSKIEKNKMNVICGPVDICKHIRNLVASFIEQNADLDWKMNIPEESIVVMADRSALTKVLNNLMLNAIKYGETFVEIKVCTDSRGEASVIITNDGNIIPHQMREKIFEAFIQYSDGRNTDGFGIGLSVAKNLARLQGGDLKMGSRDDINEFIFSLPLCCEQGLPSVTEICEIKETDSEDPQGTAKRTILIAEDHSDLRLYIRKALSQHFKVLTACNGKEAYDIICSKTNIDAVITDIKMPEMSGIELCKKIKDDATFSHILVIMLSANLTPETKLESLDIGADAIVEKPFSMEFLTSRINNLINARARLIERFSNSGTADLEKKESDEDTGLSVRDAAFIRRLNDTVEEYYTEPDFGVDELSSTLNLSRSSLNRKMRDLLNTTANNYIRERRITKAEELLRISSLQINEICYKVGFQTPSYFIKCFRQKYGKSPNEYANS